MQELRVEVGIWWVFYVPTGSQDRQSVRDGGWYGFDANRYYRMFGGERRPL
jgi:hypothetical protein